MFTVEKFKDELLDKLGSNALSIALYGSAASEDTTKRFSDTNVLVIVENAELGTLQAMLPSVKRWVAQRNPAPLVLSRKELDDGLDVFSIEFLDIRGSHRLLHGVDLFAGLRPSESGLRRQLEYEMRSKLLALQKNYFEIGGDTKRLRDLMAASLSSFTVLAKTALHLAGKPVPAKKWDVWKDVGSLIQADASPIETIFRIREGKKDALKTDATALFGAYLTLLGKLAGYIDKFAVK